MWFEELRLGGGLTNVAQAQILPDKGTSSVEDGKGDDRTRTGTIPRPSRSSLGRDALPYIVLLVAIGGNGGAAKMAAAPPCCSTVGVNRCCMMKKEVLTSADDWKR